MGKGNGPAGDIHPGVDIRKRIPGIGQQCKDFHVCAF